MKLSQIKPNPNNPRLIKDERFEKLCKSIQEAPKFMALRPIIVDGEGMILGGNMRYKALLYLGYKEVPDAWVKRADDLTEDERRRFIISDNVGFGDWDYEALANEWNAEQLEEWAVDLPLFNGEKDYFDVKEKNVLESEPKATDDGYSTFELVMLHENKLTLLDTLNQIKNNFAFEKQEEALMELIRIYNKK